MSEKTKKAAVSPVQVEAVVYCGPTVKNVVKQFTVYSDPNALPDDLTDFLNKIPTAKGMLIPVSRFAQVRAELENPKSSSSIIFAAIKAALN